MLRSPELLEGQKQSQNIHVIVLRGISVAEICIIKKNALSSMYMSKVQGAKIVTPKQLQTLEYPLPKSWVEAAGLLKKKVGGLRYQKKIRKEWERHSQNLVEKR